MKQHEGAAAAHVAAGRLLLHKISSAAAPVVRGPSVEVLPFAPPPRPGDVIVVEVVDGGGQLLELASGRMAPVNPGDLLAGVLGTRRALKGFVGDVPDTLSFGDALTVLNLGGVIGVLKGSHKGLAAPIQVKYLGTVAWHGEVPANLLDAAPEVTAPFPKDIPLILVAGTCMNAGKTKACTEIIKAFRREGFKVCAAKLTGIACRRDLLAFEDHGAIRAMSFHDLGWPSTVGSCDVTSIAKGIASLLAAEEPDLIVIEMGDGVLGEYEVEGVFEDAELRDATACTLLCANDFVGAWGAARYLAEKGAHIDVVSGPATDSVAAQAFVERKVGIAAANALDGSTKLYQIVKGKVQAWQAKHLQRSIGSGSSALPDMLEASS